MNELQLVLTLVFIVIIFALWFASSRRKIKNIDSNEDVNSEKIEIKNVVNNEEDILINPDQLGLFNDEESNTDITPDLDTKNEEQDDSNKENVSVDTHDKDVKETGLENQEIESPELEPVIETDTIVTEPQIFSIRVISSSKRMVLKDLHSLITDLGFYYTDKNNYALKDKSGKNYIYLANQYAPGVFPNISDEVFSSYTLDGIMLILKLPCSLEGGVAMQRFINSARIISQETNGKACNEGRKFLLDKDFMEMLEKSKVFAPQ